MTSVLEKRHVEMDSSREKKDTEENRKGINRASGGSKSVNHGKRERDLKEKWDVGEK